MAERFEVTLESAQIFPLKCMEVVLVSMEALSACHELQAAKQQVEAVGCARVRRVRVCVEGPLDHRVPSDEHEVRTMLFVSPFAEPAFVGGGEVRLADSRPSR